MERGGYSFYAWPKSHDQKPSRAMIFISGMTAVLRTIDPRVPTQGRDGARRAFTD